MTASLYDGSRLVYADVPVDVSVGGRWTLAVSNGQVGLGSTVRVGLAASDAAGHLAGLELSLEVIAADHLPRHLLHRTSFGATPEMLEELEALGAAEYLDRHVAILTMTEFGRTAKENASPHFSPVGVMIA